MDSPFAHGFADPTASLFLSTAIRDKFHHVIFAAMAGVQGSNQSGAVSKDTYGNGKKKGNKGPTRVGKDAKGQHRHGDYLSGTEAEQSTDAGGYSSSEEKDKKSEKGSKAGAEGQRNGSTAVAKKDPKKSQGGKKKSGGGFAFKAVGALTVFFFSGKS